MDSNEVIEVKLESPAARSAAGIIKLNDHRNGCAIAFNNVIAKIVLTISVGGENSFINNGNAGNRITAPITKNTVDSPRNDLMNFLAS
ncbi:hypothetical protein D3C77_682480 [compost metagenome]